MSIYKKLLDAVSNGIRFKIDLITKSLTIGKKKIIDKGSVLNDEDLIERWDLALENANELPLDENCWNVVEQLYNEFKHSVPREHSNGNKSYFKSVSSDELSLEEMSFNDDRSYAQARLEGYILLASLKGWLTWNDDNHFFWQSNKDKELVVLKQYVKGIN